MNIPESLKYTDDHEWVRIEGNIAVIGITDFAQGELGELVYVEVESVDEDLEQGDVFGTVEAVKTTSDLMMPVSGKVIEFNSKLDESDGDEPTLANSDPYGDGWVIKVEMSDISQVDSLMSAEDYKASIS